MTAAAHPRVNLSLRVTALNNAPAHPAVTAPHAEAVTQLGGSPLWVFTAAWPRHPQTRQLLVFVAQIDLRPFGREEMAYLFQDAQDPAWTYVRVDPRRGGWSCTLPGGPVLNAQGYHVTTTDADYDPAFQGACIGGETAEGFLLLQLPPKGQRSGPPLRRFYLPAPQADQALPRPAAG